MNLLLQGDFQVQPLDGGLDDPGYWVEAEQRYDEDGDGKYFAVKGNFSEYEEGIAIGYSYDFEVILPKIFYRNNSDQTPDYTATLTISRVKVSAGLSGDVTLNSRHGAVKSGSILNTSPMLITI